MGVTDPRAAQPLTAAGRQMLADNQARGPIWPDLMLTYILAIEAEAAERAHTLEARLREAAQAFIDELDAPPGHPLSDHYRSQAEARLREALAALATEDQQPATDEPEVE